MATEDSYFMTDLPGYTITLLLFHPMCSPTSPFNAGQGKE